MILYLFRNPGVTSLGLFASKFQSNDVASHGENIKLLFQKQSIKDKKKNLNLSQSTSDKPQEPICLIDQDKSTTSSSDGLTGSSFFKRLRVAEFTNSVSLTNFSNSESLLNPQSEPHSESNSRDSNSFFQSHSVGDWVICEECGSRVFTWKLPEHKDFHVAQRIQQEWSLQTNDRSDCTQTNVLNSKEIVNRIDRSGTKQAKKPKLKSKQLANTTSLDGFVCRTKK